MESDICMNNSDYGEGRRLERELGLMWGVLKDAVDCFMDYSDSGGESRKKLFLEAKQWLWDEDEEWVFSFINICEVLGIGPNYLRQGLLAWKNSQGPEQVKGRKSSRRFFRGRSSAPKEVSK